MNASNVVGYGGKCRPGPFTIAPPHRARSGRMHRQLTGQTLGARVRDPRRGLVAGYGMVTYDRGVCSGAAVLGQ
jgi:hypothetical protein